MFGHPHMFGCPAYVCMPLYVWTPPHVWMPLYVLMVFGCPPVHTQHKESMLCQTKGCPYAPIHSDAPCMFGCPPYFWIPPVCLDDVWMPAVYI